jgi:hypothetical protein
MVRSMDDRAWLERAEQHLFCAGVGDAAEQLCRANMTFGLAKIQHVQDQLDLPADAIFVGAPDATVTRNTHRWAAGFGYGGLVRWSPEIAVLDALPNACGMLLSAPSTRPDRDTVVEAARRARAAQLTLDGVPLAYDLGESNHFVDALELEQVLVDDAPDLPADLFVIHSSGQEHRERSPWGPGLYLHLSAELRRRATTFTTPWGPLSLLRDADAVDFFRFCDRVQSFNQRRRALYGRLLFGEHRPLCNATHQGMRAPGLFHLGSYWFDDTASLFPLTLGPDQPVYLVRPQPNIAEAQLERLGWLERAERLGASDSLQQANLLPHGGGYAFRELEHLVRVESRADGRRRFILARRDAPPLELDEIRALPFVYRDLAVLQRTIDLGLAQPVARYAIRFVIKE